MMDISNEDKIIEAASELQQLMAWEGTFSAAINARRVDMFDLMVKNGLRRYEDDDGNLFLLRTLYGEPWRVDLITAAKRQRGRGRRNKGSGDSAVDPHKKIALDIALKVIKSGMSLFGERVV